MTTTATTEAKLLTADDLLRLCSERVRGDIVFTSAEKIRLDARITGYAEVAPDLVIEVASPSDSRREVHDKAHVWLNHGVHLVWVVQPETRTIDVYRPDHAIVTLGEQHALDGLDVLPGVACDVSAVFSGPTTGAVRQNG